ncbi:N-acetylglucosamine-6-phosphate deacetylase [Arthrobacter sp. MMS18-M83]|uniref:N-acetylglucosamine-6-phosphate deacetylase n=1 Tax=Arthrobacter sp. MMS18-M83 TaxID=2996261 RepID=UPI00227BFD6A|nr:amidohydrolase family protein [Arthrobacter sp. MMS18-M83]WAH99273.1 amidohydrolase family protein [Arthrobacter sp. MMS18-M83]
MTHPKTIMGKDPYRGTNLEIAYDTTVLSVREIDHGLNRGLPVISPGFIDGQVNGYGGLDINAADITPQTVISMTAELAKLGVTTWVPTIVTASEEAITGALEQIGRACQIDPTTRAAIPCVHVEGPFISDQDGPRGVHNPDFVRPLDAQEVRRWLRASGMVGIVTVSPHASDSPAQIAQIRELGVHVAIGHTHASPEQITAAITAGARLATHLGNGIATTLPRHPNALWTQLADDRLTAGLIADGHHLPSDTLKVMIRAKTTERAYLVSDSTALAGSEPGRHRTSVGGLVDLAPGGRLSHVGTDLLAGAAATLPDGFRNVIQNVGLDLPEALKMVTSTPARVIPGTRPGLGHLHVGSPADFVLITGEGPEAGTITTAIQSGRLVSGGSA